MTLTKRMMMAKTGKCYWFNQGKCFLFHMDENMIYSILTKVPKARKDLLNCGLGCPSMDQAFLDFASDPSTMTVQPHEIEEAHMKKVNKYVDYHRYAVANSTTPKAKDDE